MEDCRLVDLTGIMYFEDFKTNIIARVKKNSHEPDQNGCRLWKASVRRGYGHMTYAFRKEGGVKVSGDSSPHKLLYMVTNSVMYLPPGLECSHRCGIGLCVTADHITAEIHDVNLTRIQCHQRRVCQYMGGQHDPACIV